jgi:L-fuconolactonase
MTDIVDSQCHVARNWYEPVESLMQQMDRNGVAQAVLVQPLGCYDNSYLLDCVERYPDRLAAVVAVDPSSAEAVQELAIWHDRGASGVRLRPTARSCGDDPYAIWEAAARLRLPVSCVGNAESFCAPEFGHILGRYATLTVVLEHLGGTSAPDTGAEMKADRKRVLELARFEGVYMKVPGLGEFEPRAATMAGALPPLNLTAARTVLGCVLASFTPKRLMWGSDYPVVSSREGYGNALTWTQQIVGELSGAACDAIFASTARQVFMRATR